MMITPENHRGCSYLIVVGISPCIKGLPQTLRKLVVRIRTENYIIQD